MLRFLLACCALWLMVQGARATSFDCATADHPVEQVVCTNEELSQLDDELAKLFHQRQSLVIEGDTYLIDGHQRHWQEVIEICSAATKIEKCLKKTYEIRTNGFKGFPSAQPWHDDGKMVFYKAEILPGYEVGLRFRTSEGDACDGETCIVEGEWVLFHSYEVIGLPWPNFVIGQDASSDICAIHDMNRLLDNLQGCTVKLLLGHEVTADNFRDMLHIADYNFDGFPDFAFGDIEFYGMVFLYQPQDKRFYYAPSLSNLFMGHDVEIDHEKQILKAVPHNAVEAVRLRHYIEPRVESYEEITYRVEHNMPVELHRTIIKPTEEDEK